MSYFNTTHSTGENLSEYRRKARTQDDAVLVLFEAFPHEKMTASQVHKRLIAIKAISEAAPITSIRRSMTNLKESNMLVKTEEQRKGPHGRPEYKYCLPTGQQDLF